MTCPRCGSAAVQPTGYCSACGHAVSAPATGQSAWPPPSYGSTTDPTGAPLPPAVDPFNTSAHTFGNDPLSTPPPYSDPAYGANPPPYGPPTDGQPPSNQPTSSQPTSAQPYGAYPSPPYPGQPAPGQPDPGQSYPGQPAPGQPYPGQPYPGQPYPGQPYPGQPYPGQPYPGQSYPGQPYPGQPYPGQPAPYGMPGAPPFYGPNASPAAGNGFSITSFVLAAIAVFIVPIVFGVGAIIFAGVARRRRERFAPLALKLAVIGTLVGFLFGALVRIL